MRGILNSGYFIGYFVTNFIGGLTVQKLGAKWVHFGGMALATAATLLCPVSADASEWVVLTMRILVGFGYVSITMTHDAIITD